MVKVRKTKAREEFGPDPSLDLPQGAHLKVMNAKLFPPKFHEETGDLWKSKVSLKLKVVDDRTEDGAADDLEFFDGYDLKFDEDVAKKFGIGPEEGAKDNDGKNSPWTSSSTMPTRGTLPSNSKQRSSRRLTGPFAPAPSSTIC
jgi:hypothetical protein